MLLRLELEEREHRELSQFATKSDETKGRGIPEEKCQLRTEFQRDRDRIIHSKALRRLMHKTQVFLSPEGDHFRTRLTHTLEVSQISRIIARSLGLNEDLTEAIAMGHDLGHTPFGHNGEESLNKVHPAGFKHNEQSLRVVDILESSSHGPGLNLTYEVRDGILNHSGDHIPSTMEGQIVRISDRVAYINHDIDDAIRAHIIKESDLPGESIKVIGNTHRTRINTLVIDIVRNSENLNSIVQSPLCKEHMNILRDYMFQNVYKSNIVKKHEELYKIEKMIESLYEYFLKNPKKMPRECQQMINGFGVADVVKDYIAGMTDRYAINVYSEIFIPKGWK
ncbi:MAG: deoxyguanosinetriphosphate triphosphohydrolase [Eubacteriales bacterium]